MASLTIQTLKLSSFQTSKPQNSHKFSQTHFTKQPQEPITLNPTSYKSYFTHISSLCKQGQLHQAINLVNQMEHKSFQIGPDIYGELLQGCVYQRAFFTGQQIHARVIKKGVFFVHNQFVESKLVIFYAKFDVFSAVDSLFSSLVFKNLFSWGAVIGMYCRVGLSKEALMGYCEMLENGFCPDNFIVPNSLKACGALRVLGFGKGVHGYVLKMGYDKCVFVCSSLVDMYGKCGVVEDGRRLFDRMGERNVVAWNSMIVSCVQNGCYREALELFCDMRMEGVELTEVCLSSFLSASANLDAVEVGKQGHAIAVLSGMELDSILGSSFVNFYTKVGLVEDAELVFVKMREKDVVTWNLLVSGYVRVGQVEKALDTCSLMRSNNLRFDSVTMSSILSTCAETRDIKLGKEGHCFCLRNNLDSDIAVASSIIDMYAKCCKIDHARHVFSSSTKRDLVIWNSMLAAYAELGMSGEVLMLFYQMQLDSVPPNVISWNSVILGFFRNGQIREAKDFFLQMQLFGIQPNLLTWNILISGLVQYGLGYEAMLTFCQMQEEGIKPNTMSIASLLFACTELASLMYGRAIHGYVIRNNLFSAEITNSLAGMYMKCGRLDQAKHVSEMVPFTLYKSTLLTIAWPTCKYLA